jgi:hypothetical protein
MQLSDKGYVLDFKKIFESGSTRLRIKPQAEATSVAKAIAPLVEFKAGNMVNLPVMSEHLKGLLKPNAVLAWFTSQCDCNLTEWWFRHQGQCLGHIVGTGVESLNTQAELIGSRMAAVDEDLNVRNIHKFVRHGMEGDAVVIVLDAVAQSAGRWSTGAMLASQYMSCSTQSKYGEKLHIIESSFHQAKALARFANVVMGTHRRAISRERAKAQKAEEAAKAASAGILGEVIDALNEPVEY